MRKGLVLSILLCACSTESSREIDTWPIRLGRAPTEPGGANVGGLLAYARLSGQSVPLVVDTAFPMASLARAICPNPSATRWSYTGTLDLLDGIADPRVRRASFRHVGLFDLCPGKVGDGSIAPSGVLGGSILAGLSVQFSFPRDPAQPGAMTLWPEAPAASDEWYAENRVVSLRFQLRGEALLTRTLGDETVTLPQTRVVLGACLAPDAFVPDTFTPTTCRNGMASSQGTGTDALLVVATGTGPLVLGETTYAQIARKLGLIEDVAKSGELYSPLSANPVPAHFTYLPRLALFASATDDNWLGPCAELGRARRIEWVLAHQGQGAEDACFQRCDASGNQAHGTAAYMELGDSILTAVISETSEIFQSLNLDAPPHARVNGMIGAQTLAGTQTEIDYLTKPQGRFIASCELGSQRSQCFSAPACPPLSKQGQTHRCFGLPAQGYAPVCDP